MILSVPNVLPMKNRKVFFKPLLFRQQFDAGITNLTGKLVNGAKRIVLDLQNVIAFHYRGGEQN